MVMKPGPVFEAVESILGPVSVETPPVATAGTRQGIPVILLTPQGRVFTQRIAEELSRYERIALLCGRYEGVDERVKELFSATEVSIGDYVMTGGEIAAMAIVDAVGRLVPGVLGSDDSAADESFTHGLLEYPQYTRPPEFRGLKVPDTLLSGNHREIARWRRMKSIQKTLRLRPDLLDTALLDPSERSMLLESECGRKQ